jgi:hypothetical protein
VAGVGCDERGTGFREMLARAKMVTFLAQKAASEYPYSGIGVPKSNCLFSNKTENRRKSLTLAIVPLSVTETLFNLPRVPLSIRERVKKREIKIQYAIIKIRKSNNKEKA